MLDTFSQNKKIILFLKLYFCSVFDFFSIIAATSTLSLPQAPSPNPHPPSKNECKEILLGCLVMYFLWGHTRRCLTPRSSCYKHTEDAFHLGFAFQPGWPLLNKKRGWGWGEGLICDPRDWSLQGLHLIHMIILKYNVPRSNVLVIFFFSLFQGLIDESCHRCFSSVLGREP